MLLDLLYRLHGNEKGEGSAKEEEVETMEDLEAEDEEEEVRLNGCGSSKVMMGVLESISAKSCFESPIERMRI